MEEFPEKCITIGNTWSLFPGSFKGQKEGKDESSSSSASFKLENLFLFTDNVDAVKFAVEVSPHVATDSCGVRSVRREE